MTMRFPYAPMRLRRPAVSLGGRTIRPRPLISVTLLGPADVSLQDGLLDTGADDTIFSDTVAAQIGLDLSNAPVGDAAGLGPGVFSLRFAQVVLRVADNFERREWTAWVGFTSAPLRHPTLGFAGFLQYFTATFYGDREEV